MHNILKQILDIFKQHVLVFYSTVKRLEKVEQTTNELIEQMKDINSKQNITNGLLIANETASLYIGYYVKPVFHHRLGYSSWDKFCDRLAAIEAEIDDRPLDASEKGLTIPYETLYKDLINYLQPLQKDIGLSLIDIRFLKRDRNDLVHYRYKSDDQQKDLLEKAKQFNFSNTFEFKDLVKRMIDDLERKKDRFHYFK
ncbi:unnamed protein product [Adineta steineri]|uniref:Uncharacterized protein n=1 Tax=Adineta steineri TaxID=433720 RepID=A0A819T2S3_9BILA|nr:unnamed protein product [Adineta steineri]CAF1476240.1 unnamed protein product [Adineta steineri]CAF3581113.1 unnamed protein product [Adineta steineri]CAF4074716.1 unnamed protein product [Adineta steineri]